MSLNAYLKQVCILLVLVGSLSSIQCSSDLDGKSGTMKHMPLNFRDAIARINNFVILSTDYLTLQSQSNFTVHKAISHLFNVSDSRAKDIWTLLQVHGTETLSELLASSYAKAIRRSRNEPNITTDCLFQLQQLNLGLSERSNWAYRVLDAFGKPPSGILSGNLDWYGEFTECLNISAMNDTWHGRYALITKPIDPQDMFKPYSAKV